MSGPMVKGDKYRAVIDTDKDESVDAIEEICKVGKFTSAELQDDNHIRFNWFSAIKREDGDSATQRVFVCQREAPRLEKCKSYLWTTPYRSHGFGSRGAR